MKKWIVGLAAGLLLLAGSANAVLLSVNLTRALPHTMYLYPYGEAGPHTAVAIGTGHPQRFTFEVPFTQDESYWDFEIRSSIPPAGLADFARLELYPDWMHFRVLPTEGILFVDGRGYQLQVDFTKVDLIQLGNEWSYHVPFGPIPEPQTWLALAVGLALVGGFYARRTSRSRVHAVLHKA